MNVGIWRTSYSCPVPLVREVPGRWSFGHQSLCRLVTTTVFPNEINLKTKWFAMTGFLYYVENLFCVQPRLGMAWRLCVEGMPCNSDLYVYLNIEVVIGLVQ